MADSLTPRLPKYRHDKPKDLAVVRIDGHDHYLGRFGSEESKEKYRRLIAERLVAGRVEPIRHESEGDAPDLTIRGRSYRLQDLEKLLK